MLSTTVVKFCVRRLGIPESDIRRIDVLPFVHAYRVRMWNHRRIFVTAQEVHTC